MKVLRECDLLPADGDGLAEFGAATRWCYDGLTHDASFPPHRDPPILFSIVQDSGAHKEVRNEVRSWCPCQRRPRRRMLDGLSMATETNSSFQLDTVFGSFSSFRETSTPWIAVV